MANEIPGNSSEQPLPEKRCILTTLFLKDLSFESPHVPGILLRHEKPTLKFHVETTYKLWEKDVYEVVVDLNVHAAAGDKTLFLIEIKQGGMFEVTGHSTDEIVQVLRTRAPETLYPFARELASSLINRGGFPRPQLRPFDFEASFAQLLLDKKQAAALPAEQPP